MINFVWLGEIITNLNMLGWVVFIVSGVIFSAIFITEKCNGDLDKDLFQTLKTLKKSLIIVIFISFPLIFLPSKEAYYAGLVIKQVNIYNEVNTNSSLTPEQILGVVDHSIDRLEKIISIAENKTNS